MNCSICGEAMRVGDKIYCRDCQAKIDAEAEKIRSEGRRFRVPIVAEVMLRDADRRRLA